MRTSGGECEVGRERERKGALRGYEMIEFRRGRRNGGVSAWILVVRLECMHESRGRTRVGSRPLTPRKNGSRSSCILDSRSVLLITKV